MSKKQWVRVQAPEKWEPSKKGEEIEGRYNGFKLLSGPYGTFKSHSLITPEGRIVYFTSGQASAVIEAAGVRNGESLRVVFDGVKKKDKKEFYTFSAFFDPAERGKVEE